MTRPYDKKAYCGLGHWVPRKYLVLNRIGAICCPTHMCKVRLWGRDKVKKK